MLIDIHISFLNKHVMPVSKILMLIHIRAIKILEEQFKLVNYLSIAYIHFYTFKNIIHL